MLIRRCAMASCLVFLVFLVFLIFIATKAHADEICADRPSKATGTCTVKQGHWNISDNTQVGFSDNAGVGTTQNLFLAPTLKYGVNQRMDVEAYMPLLQETISHSATSKSDVTGNGDLTLRAKYKIVYADGHYTGPLEFGIEPFIVAPIGHQALTDHGFEGGALMPIGIRLSPEWLLGFDPEVDVLRNKIGEGTHLATQQIVSLSHSLTNKLTVGGELWGKWNFDPIHGTVKQVSSDLVFTYVIAKHFELDTGANIGLNKDTPKTQVFAGFSKRF
jgi:hypothetical protein